MHLAGLKQKIETFLGTPLPADFLVKDSLTRFFAGFDDVARYFVREDLEKCMLERAPFFFIERVVVVGDTAWGTATMTEERSGGHFPGKPIVPLIELCKGMAQTGIILVALLGAPEQAPIAIGSGRSKAIARDFVRAPATVLFKVTRSSAPIFVWFGMMLAEMLPKSVSQKWKFLRNLQFARRFLYVAAVAYQNGEPIGSLDEITYILLSRKQIMRGAQR